MLASLVETLIINESSSDSSWLDEDTVNKGLATFSLRFDNYANRVRLSSSLLSFSVAFFKLRGNRNELSEMFPITRVVYSSKVSINVRTASRAYITCFIGFVRSINQYFTIERVDNSDYDRSGIVAPDHRLPILPASSPVYQGIWSCFAVSVAQDVIYASWFPFLCLVTIHSNIQNTVNTVTNCDWSGSPDIYLFPFGNFKQTTGTAPPLETIFR